MTFKREWVLYKYINTVPDITMDEIHWNLKWSLRKVKRYIKKLIQHGLIKEYYRGYTAIDWKDLVNWDNMNTRREDYK